ncbi:MAG: hypothetical protein U0Q12_08270 [Vicinamibacterales bacterium]
MVIAVVEDLLFSSKIRAVAKRLGVDVKFVRDAGAVVSEIRAARPRLVVFDLNADRLDPLGAARALRADPELATIPTVGFVSHVQVELIGAARTAGVGDVMARSLFVARLADLIAGGLPPPRPS